MYFLKPFSLSSRPESVSMAKEINASRFSLQKKKSN